MRPSRRSENIDRGRHGVGDSSSRKTRGLESAELVALPSLASREGDFSNTEFNPLGDLATCRISNGCATHLENNIPQSRLDPTFGFARRSLPAANVEVEGRSLDVLHVEGALISGTPFRIGSEDNTALARFGGYDLVPFGPFPTAHCQLFVDGALVASNETEYDVIAYPVP